MATPIFSIFLRILLSGSFIFLCLLFSLNPVHAYEGRESTTETHHRHIVQVTSLSPPSVPKPSTRGTTTQSKGASLEVVYMHGAYSHLSQDNANAPNLTQLPIELVSLGNYIVKVGLGTTMKELSFTFTTGSDLTWTQCKPCANQCYNQTTGPIFDPSKSSSYANIPSHSPSCPNSIFTADDSPCTYHASYNDGSYSEGFIAREILSLTSTDVFTPFLFGCGHNNSLVNFRSKAASGFLGLGRGNLSFVSQAAQKYIKFFSYCLPTIFNPTSGHLTFGEGSGGVSSNIKFTPLLKNPRAPSLYFIEMIGISVGLKNLSVPKSEFLNPGTIIDSGTTITRLPELFYNATRSVFREMMSNYTLTDPYWIFDTCYDFTNYSMVLIPKISFFFSNGVELEVDVEGIIYEASLKQVCLALAPKSRAEDLAVLGNFQQQTFDVVYDVAGGRLGFDPGVCS